MLVVKLVRSLLIGVLISLASTVQAQDGPKLLVVPFQLNDMTDLPNAPEELKRIELLSSSFQKALEVLSVNTVPLPEEMKQTLSEQSPTYVFDHVDYAADMGTKAGADFVFIGVALKPTYLFVYPRVLLVDVKQRKVAKAHAFQLESSWSDENTTVNTAKRIARTIKEDLDKYQKY